MTNNDIDISNLRREYTQGELRRIHLTNEPMDLFSIWLQEAYNAKLFDPNAACLATVNDIGQPYQRLILLKNFDKNSLKFFTNLNSRKSNQLNFNSCVSLHFPWHALDRQVMILGKVKKISLSDVKKYFYSRPINSQISTWVSHQSDYIASRDILENRFFLLKKKFNHNKIPLPKFWGGYQVIISAIEFWQGRKYRLHDRFIYKRNKKRNIWQINRLSP